MTFRHPLRNEFDRVKAQLEADAKKPGPEGAQSRAMLAIMPGFIDWLETERDKGTSPIDRVEAIRGIIGNLIRHAITTPGSGLGNPRDALFRVLGMIERDVAPRLAPSSKIILPGLPH